MSRGLCGKITYNSFFEFFYLYVTCSHIQTTGHMNNFIPLNGG